CQQNNKWPRTF
nr:immunoglobulin light chain junction region [Macaca mulatta]MOV86529.1 immunoglobulin light chain junction region [Macaca mulatta]